VGIRAQKVGITARKIHKLSTLRGRVINIPNLSFQHLKSASSAFFRRDIAGIKQADQSTKNKKQE
jgi:hypothetical protein